VTDTSIGDTSEFTYDFCVTAADNELFESFLKIVLIISFAVFVNLKDINFYGISLNKQLV